MAKRVLYFILILAMLFGAAGCSPQNQANVEAWNTLFFGSEIELQNQPPEYSETLLDAINKYIGENCPLRKDYDIDGNGQMYTICRDFEGEAIEVKSSDFLGLGLVGLTAVSPIPGDELLAVKWAWNSEKTIKVIIAVVFTIEAANTINVVYSKTSNPLHDPHQSQVARNHISRIWNDIQIKLSDPKNPTGPILYCAVVVYQNGVQYVRVLSTVDNVTGIMSWYGNDGWVHAFDNKDVYGFLNGMPRGAISYDVSRPLQDCLNALGKGVPAANSYAP